jgi:molybdopterin/thiamine biosynthesis adenylyltransferase
MRYAVTFAECHFDALVRHLFEGADSERAAYLICGVARDSERTRLLVREVLPVTDGEVLERSSFHLVIPSPTYIRALKRAADSSGAFVFVHSHPSGRDSFSAADDSTESSLFRTAYNRIPGLGPHASLVFSGPDQPLGRVWLPDGSQQPVHDIGVIGTRLRFFRHADASEPEAGGGQERRKQRLEELGIFDRQIRAFGEDLQPLLRQLTVGVVGAGGTGSSVIEQLIRLGVGHIIVSDGEGFDRTNVNRVYGSRLSDHGTPKVELVSRLASEIGLGTRVTRVATPITWATAFRQLLQCDLVFGCTDDEWGRSILTRLPIWYYIPVIDMGVRIDSADGTVRSVQGRVTVLQPGSACLFCRNRITSQRILNESLSVTSPDEAKALREEGYLVGLDEPAPAVVPFTTAIAASAISEFLHRITGYMGPDHKSSEVIHLFDAQRLRSNDRVGDPQCFCMDVARWGRGDERQLLGLTWRQR